MIDEEEFDRVARRYGRAQAVVAVASVMLWIVLMVVLS